MCINTTYHTPKLKLMLVLKRQRHYTIIQCNAWMQLRDEWVNYEVIALPIIIPQIVLMFSNFTSLATKSITLLFTSVECQCVQACSFIETRQNYYSHRIPIKNRKSLKLTPRHSSPTKSQGPKECPHPSILFTIFFSFYWWLIARSKVRALRSVNALRTPQDFTHQLFTLF